MTMGGFGVWHWLAVVLYLVVLGVPVARILGRVGLSAWWTILAFIPFVNVIALWVFAFAQWPQVPDRAN